MSYRLESNRGVGVHLCLPIYIVQFWCWDEIKQLCIDLEAVWVKLGGKPITAKLYLIAVEFMCPVDQELFTGPGIELSNIYPVM